MAMAIDGDGDGWIACLGWGDSIDGAASGECFELGDECFFTNGDCTGPL